MDVGQEEYGRTHTNKHDIYPYFNRSLASFVQHKKHRLFRFTLVNIRHYIHDDREVSTGYRKVMHSFHVLLAVGLCLQQSKSNQQPTERETRHIH